jgi:uncharacterized protein with PIN domain
VLGAPPNKALLIPLVLPFFFWFLIETLTRSLPTFERCSVCNVAIERVPPAAARLRVPERVAASTDRFWRCPSCGRIYWHGSHAERLRVSIGRALRGLASP